jgi:hypothetical protein
MFAAGVATFGLLYCVQPLMPEFSRLPRAIRRRRLRGASWLLESGGVGISGSARGCPVVTEPRVILQRA